MMNREMANNRLSVTSVPKTKIYEVIGPVVDAGQPAARDSGSGDSDGSVLQSGQKGDDFDALLRLQTGDRLIGAGQKLIGVGEIPI